jgi:hypothetical protein
MNIIDCIRVLTIVNRKKVFGLNLIAHNIEICASHSKTNIQLVFVIII